MTFPAVEMKTAVVTGCSTGIGLATARLLKSNGWRVAATARNPEDVSRLRGEGLDAFLLDVADAASVDQASQQLLEHFRGQVGALVNNAGFGQVGAMEDLSRAALEYQFAVNVVGLQDFTNRFIPVMRRQGFGRIVNISSVLGRVSLPFMGSYSASKFAVEAMSDAMRVELAGSGIAVVLVEPGPIATAFRENAAHRGQATLDPDSVQHADYYQHELKRRAEQNRHPDPFTLPPEAVAHKIRHAVESPRPKTRYKVTVPAYLGAFMARFAPDWVIDAMMARQTVHKKAALR
jgi:NAD(P)-dependent dehydrogenase (short-subunit alcohol dehydrogenase family)